MSKTQATDWIGKVLQDTYRLERLIGEGGMGAVYEASHLRLRRRFAIKLLTVDLSSHDVAMARFQQEAEVTSALGHPNIVEVTDFNNTKEGQPYLVMEFLEGETLEKRLRRLGKLMLQEVEPILKQIASALDAAHAKGIVHRDLKPGNIILRKGNDDQEIVKILDFGVSKVLGAAQSLTSTSMVLGTPWYMAPEQAQGRASEADLRCDVFAAGVIVYEMLIGEPPFTGESVPSVLYQIVHKQIDSPSFAHPYIPESISEVVCKALEKDPQARFASMGEFSRAFSSAAQEAISRQAPVLLPKTVAGFDGSMEAKESMLLEEGAQSIPRTREPVTTLSSGVGEIPGTFMSELAPPKWSKLKVVIGAAALAAIVVLFFLFMGKADEPSKHAATEPLKSTKKIPVSSLSDRADMKITESDVVFVPSKSLLPKSSAPLTREHKTRKTISVIKKATTLDKKRSQTKSKPSSSKSLAPGSLLVVTPIEIEQGGTKAGWAHVYVDGVSALKESPVKITNLSAGWHNIKVEREGYLTVERKVLVKSDEQQIIRILLKK